MKRVYGHLGGLLIVFLLLRNLTALLALPYPLIHSPLAFHPLPLFSSVEQRGGLSAESGANNQKALQGLYFGYFDANLVQPGGRPV